MQGVPEDRMARRAERAARVGDEALGSRSLAGVRQDPAEQQPLDATAHLQPLVADGSTHVAPPSENASRPRKRGDEHLAVESLGVPCPVWCRILRLAERGVDLHLRASGHARAQGPHGPAGDPDRLAIDQRLALRERGLRPRAPQ